MNPPKEFSEVIGRVRYDVQKATLIASNVYWDGRNMERNCTNTFLYKTKKGNFFTIFLTQWQGARDILTPVSEDEAIELYEDHLFTREVPYEEAFPNVVVEDA